MTERPYTDDDLRAEAARYAGDDMDGLRIITAMADRAPWAGLDTEAFNEAHGTIIQLVENAADTSEWAVNLGADGLEPDEHALTWSAGQQPIVRVHFAFHPGLSDEARDALVQAVGGQLEPEMRAAAGGVPSLAELYDDTPPERL